jgi:hypothetical protein
LTLRAGGARALTWRAGGTGAAEVARAGFEASVVPEAAGGAFPVTFKWKEGGLGLFRVWLPIRCLFLLSFLGRRPLGIG